MSFSLQRHVYHWVPESETEDAIILLPEGVGQIYLRQEQGQFYVELRTQHGYQNWQLPRPGEPVEVF